MHYLYIIFSETSNRYYIGESHDVAERLKKHNDHSYAGAFTKTSIDWKIALSFGCTKEEALKLEKFIKRMKSRKFIEKIIRNPEILKDILSK